MGDDYHREIQKDQPSLWSQAATIDASQLKAGKVTSSPLAERWWENFHDERLNYLISRLTSENLNIQEAGARIEQARGELKISASAGLPNVNWAGSYIWTQQSTRGFLTIAQAAPGANFQYQAYNNIGSSSWDLDLFGMIRRFVEASREDMAAENAAYHAVILSTLSELVETYIRLRAVQAQITLTKENIGFLEKDLLLTQQRQKEGEDNREDVAHAKAVLSQMRGDLPTLLESQARLINGIGFLLNLPPRSLEEYLTTKTHSQPLPPLWLGVGIPAHLLDRRPDVMEAEAQLHSALARVGAAKAAFYPDIILMGDLGTQGLSASDFFLPAAKYFTLGPTMTMPFFEGGRLRGRLILRKSQEKEAALAYRQTLLNAWREVDDMITRLAQLQDHYEKLLEMVRQYQEALLVSREQFKEGAINAITLHQREEILCAHQMLLAQALGETSQAVVNLYRALGGGWQALDKDYREKKSSAL